MNIPIIKLGIVRAAAVIHAVSTNVGITVTYFQVSESISSYGDSSTNSADTVS